MAALEILIDARSDRKPKPRSTPRFSAFTNRLFSRNPINPTISSAAAICVAACRTWMLRHSGTPEWVSTRLRRSP